MVDFSAQRPAACPGRVRPPGECPSSPVAAVEEAIRLGCGAVLFPSRPGEGRLSHPSRLPRACGPRSPTPTSHSCCTSVAAAEGSHPAFHCNGKPPTTDFLGGGENIHPRTTWSSPWPPRRSLSCLILDGDPRRVPEAARWLHRTGCDVGRPLASAPRPRAGVVPEDRAHAQAPPLRASEYVHRQLQFTPFPTEPVGWLIEQSGDDLFLFSSDYPHPEGGRDPLARFEASLEGTDDEAKHRFYAGNYRSCWARPRRFAPSVAAFRAVRDTTHRDRDSERTAETTQSRWGARSGGA